MALSPEQKRTFPQKDFEIRKITGLEDRFNAAAWSTTDGAIMLLVREVKEAAEEGRPDVGPLVILKKDARMVEVRLEDYDPVADKVVWDPEGKVVLLEDPRALLLSDGDGVVLGLTAIDQKIPYPAITYVPRDQFEEINDGQVRIIRDFGPGKNTTPLDDGTFLFRKDGDENNHRLARFSRDENTDEVGELKSIDFPSDLEWASWRIGTTISPIPINDSEYLMIFHGAKKENGVLIYSLGRAILVKNEEGKLEIIKVDSEPILTPEDVKPFSRGELHEEKKVVYACGGIIEGDNKTSPKALNLFVNVGDKITVMVRLPYDTLVALDKPLMYQRKHST
ncbi:MAG: hypothetical protein ABH812_01835 [bacterium]